MAMLFKPPKSGSELVKKARRKRGENDQRLIKLLSQPLILEEVGPPRLLSHLMRVVSALIVGLIVSIGQAVTSVQEQSLSFLPKLVANVHDKVNHLTVKFLSQRVI